MIISNADLARLAWMALTFGGFAGVVVVLRHLTSRIDALQVRVDEIEARPK